MLLSADDFEEADFERAEKQQLRVWSLCQPPSMEEILESQRIRGEYEKCAQVRTITVFRERRLLFSESISQKAFCFL